MLTLILELLRLGGSHVVSRMESLTIDDVVDVVGVGMGLETPCDAWDIQYEKQWSKARWVVQFVSTY